MGKRIKVEFTGAGWMAEQFIRKLASRPDTELVAVHDPNRKAAETIAVTQKRSSDPGGIPGTVSKSEYDWFVDHLLELRKL